MTRSAPPAAQDQLDLLNDLIARTKRAGADAVDALAVASTSLGLSWRLGALEDVERSEGISLGLRAMVGQRQAVVSTNDLSRPVLDELVSRVVAMARIAPEDPYVGLADAALLARSLPALDLLDSDEPSTEALAGLAKEAEDSARAVKGITNSEGGSASWGRSGVALATSGGFAGAYAGSHWSIGVSVVAGTGTGMERDWDHSATRHRADLESPGAIGQRAGEKAVRRLGPRKMESRAMPVVFDPRVANSLIGHFAGAINGVAVARKTSFLKDRMGQAVFAPGIRIIDDPHRQRGLRSKPVDAEGVANRETILIEDGHLRSWLLDTASARQLGLTSTGHASRGVGAPPSPSTTNLYLAAGTRSADALMSGIKEGLYVTELIGFGVNMVTGDYSRGAAGFRIRDGKLDHPVSEVTVAGTLQDMFRRLVPANDLVFRYGTDAPTLLIENL
ncbi:MAG: TldD/PmbA family protein, partial [Alphaproteobacteria bacterium]|nr:TldD/PmbA family protein [Alphaproteobacteria bacterium]